MKTVFLDTNIFKFCTTGILKYCQQAGSSLYINYDDPNTKLDEKMRAEVECLHKIFKQYKDYFRFQTSLEVRIERMRCTLLAEPKSVLEAVDIEDVLTPIQVSRPLISKETEACAFRGIKHLRFLELQKASGIFGSEHIKINTLLDIFHIWTAEYAGSDYFLTLDKKLLGHVANHKTYPPRVKIISASELLSLAKINFSTTSPPPTDTPTAKENTPAQ